MDDPVDCVEVAEVLVLDLARRLRGLVDMEVVGVLW
jgi:hypothetical protein